MTEQLAIWPDEPGDVFRPIHYLGSKLRLLEVIESVIDVVEPTAGRVLDLFSGTGVVAAHLARHRAVVAADVQEYARVLAGALVAPAALSPTDVRTILALGARHAVEVGSPRVADLVAYERACLARAEAGAGEALSAVVEEGSLLRFTLGNGVRDRRLESVLAPAAAELPTGAGTVLTRYYGGVYFSYEQALVLDGLACAVRRLPQPLRDVGLAAVMSTASDIVSSIGNHFAQPLRPRDGVGRLKADALRAIARRRRLSVQELFVEWLDRYASLPASDHDAWALQGDFREILRNAPSGIRVVYADPPYTRDHYSRYYHVLETIAIGDEPEVSTMRLGTSTLISRGLYRMHRHQSPFSIKSQAPNAFRALLAGVRDLEVPLVLSYSPHGEGSASRPRMMAVDEIADLATQFYAEVNVTAAGRFAHSKMNAAHLNSEVVYDAEVLIVCRP